MTGRLHTWLVGAVGILAVVAIWWLAATTFLAGHHIPTPPDVISKFHEKGFSYYREIFSITLKEAAIGYLWGVLIALLLAVAVLLIPVLEPVIMQFAVITYCLPIVVLAPILIVAHEIPAKGGTSATAIDLAAVSVIFTTVVGAVLGFRSADQASLDVVQVYGGGPVQQFLRVRLVSALPALFTTLQMAAPAAYLGALLGEWFDKHLEIGVGPSLYLAQNNRETALAWTLGFGCAIVSGLAYFAIGWLGRAIAPWAKGTSR
ncbi:ABC transporter permease [Nocardioides sp.]|uniref:ABC transporter permease n=1 Tax=Nocardioides sp. TaxID=35761 RepID=UPI0039E38138